MVAKSECFKRLLTLDHSSQIEPLNELNMNLNKRFLPRINLSMKNRTGFMRRFIMPMYTRFVFKIWK